MENITLSQIGIYNTQRVTDAQSKALFIARHRQFETIMNSLKESVPDDCPQHHLIVAQRGMGKTTMLKRIEVELKTSPWNERYMPVLFPEEQYNIQDLSSFWLNTIDALADLMEMYHDYNTVEEIDNVVKNLERILNADERASEAYKFIQLFSGKCKKRLVLLVDNLNIIFSRLSRDEQHTMRALMSENGAPIIVGASPIMINELMNYDAPFYDSFRIQLLEKLSLDEISAIIINLAELTGSDEIKNALNKYTSRIKSLYQLAGGNPRTAVILFRLLSRGFSPDINDDLEALLDDLTPVYKGKLEELSEQLQIIIDAIALAWEPVTLEQIRSTTRLESGQVSPQLKRLIDTGWIEKPSTRQGKGGAYELTERIFNIWYLMRRSSRRHKKSIHCLSKFMEVYYSGELDVIAEKYLSIPFHTTNEVITALALAKLLPDSTQGTELCLKSRNFLFEHSKEYSDLLLQLGRGDLYPKSSLIEMVQKLQAAIQKSEYIEAHYIVDSMLTEDQQSLDDEDKYLLTFYSALIYSMEENYDEAENILRSALQMSHEGYQAELMLVNFLSLKDETRDEALDLVNSVIERHSDDIECIKARANVYYYRKEYDCAIRDLLDILDINPQDIDILRMLGNAYNCNGDFESGLKIYSQLYEIDKARDKIWSEYTYSLIATGRTVDAHKVLNATEEIHGNELDFYYISGELAICEEKYEEAIKLFERCLDESRVEIIVERLALLYVMQGYYDRAYQLCLKEVQYENFELIIKTGNYFAFSLNEYENAESCYKLCLGTSYETEGNYLLLHLYRDYMHNTIGSQLYFDRLLKNTDECEVQTSLYLEKMVCELYLKNIGSARKLFADYIDICNKVDDLQYPGLIYALAQIVRLGRIEDIIDILEAKRMDVEIAPIYHAILSFNFPDITEYLDKIPYEIRDIANNICESIKSYI